MRYKSTLRPRGTSTITVSIISFLAVFLIAVPVFGQLTADDIAALQEQGEREGWTFTVSQNPATEYSLKELCGTVKPGNWYEMAPFNPMATKAILPEAFDWRDYGDLPPVKNQGGCGSCWAFATVGVLECVVKIQDGIDVDLSEQWLVDCNRDHWSCDGGWLAHDYHEWKGDQCGDHGAVFESYLPYLAVDLACGCPYRHSYTIDSWSYIGTRFTIPTPDAMKQAIMEYGPISVGMYVNSAFQSYSAGVFNGCEEGNTNHTVVLVGWDDNQGEEGVWFMRNSWGEVWGEDGYMRIEYGCSLIGEGASYVVYNGAGFTFSADTLIGWTPFDVNFEASAPTEVTSWSWDFGDGGTASVQSPSHTFNDNGLYNISVQADMGGELRTATRYDYIIALADTIRADTQIVTAGTQYVAVINAVNSTPLQIRIPVEFAGTLKLTLDSMSTVGCRTDYFEIQKFLNFDPFNSRASIKLGASDLGTSPHLEPGEGPIVKLYFTVAGTATSGQFAPLVFDGYSTYLPDFESPLAQYAPGFVNGLMYIPPLPPVSCCVGIRGNANADEMDQLNSLDLLYLVNYLYKSGPEPECFEEGDVNADGKINSLDILYLVNYLYRLGTVPPSCP